MARTFALIAPVWRVLQQVLCNSETVPYAPKRKETHQNMSLGSNDVDQERSFRKILTRYCCTNFSINCTSLSRFALSFVCSKFRAVAKWFQMHPNRKGTHQNMSLGSNGVDRERSLLKFTRTFALIAPVWPVLL